MGYFGRKVIYSNAAEVNASNVLDVLAKSRPIHLKNRNKINFLYKYYRGIQPILNRKKDVRPEICNKIAENRAYEIVSFKVGYLCGEPIQYVSRSSKAQVGRDIARLNDMMLAESRATKDKEMFEWQMIAGTAYKMAMVSENKNAFSPFEIYITDPRDSYVIYSSAIGNKPLAGVYIGKDETDREIQTVYTDSEVFVCRGNEIIDVKSHALGRVPLVEYPANNARLGAFEPVIPILDAINTVASNRIDGVEQFVQSLMKFINCEIDKDTFAQLMQLGAIQIKSSDGNNADVEIMTQELNQTQTQTLVDYMYQTVLTITGMPNRNGGSSTSDTGAASLLRDGWSSAEARAKDSELMFKRSEQELLKIILPVCEELSGVRLSLQDVEIKFTRRNYENIQTKSQVLTTMLNNDKIDPRLAFYHCGLFTDSEEAYQLSMKWYEKQTAEMQKSLKEGLNDGRSAESV